MFSARILLQLIQCVIVLSQNITGKMRLCELTKRFLSLQVCLRLLTSTLKLMKNVKSEMDVKAIHIVDVNG